jgi:hypothetical protein
MKTEEEARKCWCPFTRAAAVDSVGAGRWRLIAKVPPFNRFFHTTDGLIVPDTARCIASECMAWRWEENAETWTTGEKKKPNSMSNADGYCGLAGKP